MGHNATDSQFRATRINYAKVCGQVYVVFFFPHFFYSHWCMTTAGVQVPNFTADWRSALVQHVQLYSHIHGGRKRRSSNDPQNRRVTKEYPDNAPVWPVEKDRTPPAGRPNNEQDYLSLYRTCSTAALHRCLRVKLNHWRQELWIYMFSITVCGVSLKHRGIFLHFFFTFRSLAVVQNFGISIRGWLVFNWVFRFGGHKCTQILSGLKKVVFLYYIHTTYDT